MLGAYAQSNQPAGQYAQDRESTDYGWSATHETSAVPSGQTRAETRSTACSNDGADQSGAAAVSSLSNPRHIRLGNRYFVVLGPKGERFILYRDENAFQRVTGLSSHYD